MRKGVFDLLTVLPAVAVLVLGGCQEPRCPLFGVSVNNMFFTGSYGDPQIEQAYQENVQDLFAWAMPAGTGKWLNVHPAPDDYRPEGVRFMLDWLEAHGMGYDIFHNIVVPKFDNIPDWYWYLPDPQVRRDALEEHVRTIISFLGNRIPVYNVVNHVYNNSFKDALQDNYLLTGWNRVEAVTQILHWARDANPGAILMVNEGGDTVEGGGVITNPTERQAYIAFLEALLANGAPLDAIGLMGHFGRDTGEGHGKLPSDTILHEALQAYSGLGLPIHFTEFDVSYGFAFLEDPTFDPGDPFAGYDSWWDYQAWAYDHAFDLLSSYPRVRMIHLWAFWDGYLWHVTPGAGLFDEAFMPKPVHQAVAGLLRGAKARSCPQG